jgi:hypothetical protein
MAKLMISLKREFAGAVLAPVNLKIREPDYFP